MRKGSVRRGPCLFAVAGWCGIAGSGCEKAPTAPPDAGPAQASAPAATQSRPAGASGELVLTPAMLALASQPTTRPTGSFLDRGPGTELRVVSYNVNHDKIFPSVDSLSAEKFQRVFRALDADILCLQEISDDAGDDLQKLLNLMAPLTEGYTWHVYVGNTNATVSRWPLSLTGDRLSVATYRDPALALVDLPDERFAADVYVLNNHFKCCDPETNDAVRQKQADAICQWIHDARDPEGELELPPFTPILVMGDLNLVGTLEPLRTLLTGDVHAEDVCGPDRPPDWDDTELTDAQPRHNASGADTYTWRNDRGRFDPERMDFVIYTDSVLEAVHSFVLNTVAMSPEELSRCGLKRWDTTRDTRGSYFDHLPVVVDFRLRPSAGAENAGTPPAPEDDDSASEDAAP